MKNILLCMKLSDLAYKDIVGAQNGVNALGLKHFEWIENTDTDTQGFICANDGDVFIIVRGTESWDDWKTNLDCRFEVSKYGAVHSGFKSDAESIYSQVVDALIKHIVAKRRIYVAGHSQGAGVSKQLALRLLENGFYVYRAIGYGEPRSVSADTAGRLDAEFPDVFHRVVNNNDLVTRVPLRIMGYKHYGTLHYFFENGNYSTDTTAWERFLDRISGCFEDFGEYGSDALKDHAQAAYIGCIGREFGA